jgi:hypothetical protein
MDPPQNGSGGPTHEVEPESSNAKHLGDETTNTFYEWLQMVRDSSHGSAARICVTNACNDILVQHVKTKSA